MLVLGVDPGTYKMGIGLVESDGESYSLRLSDALSPPRKAELAARLGWLHGRLEELVAEIRPDVVAVESPFVGRNIKAAISVGQAQAVAMVAAASHGIPVSMYAPREVKKAVTDNGGSSKEQVQDMVQFLLDLPDPLEPSDRADAAAVAICHINNTQIHDIEMWE
ncbi:MAG: crossover junction endodeoxyribonuclease RuvC [Dehalococcoidia bacterium]|nr:crossover junction endodeoxyribonuclease RuvC [Dehalococcoidia bacterium]